MTPSKPLNKMSIVIPARDEEGCIASTVQHLHLELELHQVPHEIIVVDDGSSDRTWPILQELRTRLPELNPVQNNGAHGFGRAIICGLNHMTGDAATIMMADESDDCRDVVRYWNHLNEGYDCVFGSRFIKGGGVIDYPFIKYWVNRAANLFIRLLFAIRLNDTTNAFKAYRRTVIDGCRPLLSPPLQPHRRTPPQSHRPRLLLDRHPHHLAQPPHRRGQTQDQGNGQPLPLHLPLRLAGKILQPRRLPQAAPVLTDPGHEA